MPNDFATSVRERRKPVARSAHGANELVLTERRERDAKPADVDIDRALFDIDVTAPHAIEKLRAAVNAIGMQHEELEEPIFGRPERDLGFAYGDLMASRIELEPADFDGLAVVAMIEATERSIVDGKPVEIASILAEK